MPDRSHYRSVARELKNSVRSKGSFDTIQRFQITTMLRAVSGEPRAQIKSRVAADLELALAHEGLRCFPSLDGTEGSDYHLVFSAGGVLGYLVDLIAYPSPHTARELGIVLRKVKGLPAPETRDEGDSAA